MNKNKAGCDKMNISSLDIGFRFLPPDEEIISFFLLNKMKGYHDRTRHIREVDLLKQEPRELPALSIVQSRYPEWFFFYKLNKISKGKNDRATKAGFWKSMGQDRMISDGGRVIGTKKTLIFYEGRTPSGVKTDWVMHEYRATADFIPPNMESTYVVGCLRNKAAENSGNSMSNHGLPSSNLAASSSQNNAAGVTSMGVAPQLLSNRTDFEIALQMQMQYQGMVDCDLYNDPNRMEEEEITFEDPLSYDLVDDKQNELQFQFDTIIEEEKDFMASNFPDHDERSYIEDEYPRCPDYRAPDYAGDSSGTDPESTNAWYDQLFLRSSPGEAQAFYLQRKENLVHHNEIVDTISHHHVLPCQINCFESVREEKSINSRAWKSQMEQGRPTRVLQMKLSEKAVSRDKIHKTRESGVSGPVVEIVQNKKSIVRSNKGPKMNRDQNIKSDLNSRTSRSEGSSRKNSFNFQEMSQLSYKQNPPLVYVRNVLVGVILFIAVIREVIFLVR